MCKCRRVEIPGTKPIKGIIYCSECIEDHKAEAIGLKLLMVTTLLKELDEIKREVNSLASTTIHAFKEVKMN